jgi:gluconolactonase
MPGGFLIFSDIPANTIYKWSPDGKTSVFRKPSGNTNGNALDKKGRLLCCQHDRHLVRIEKNGAVTILADKYLGRRLNSPNDLVVHSSGSIYFTDPPYGLPNQSEGKELDFQGVYRLTPKGELNLLVKDFTRPNGIALSPDEKKLYVNDSEVGHIRVFDVREDGTIANGEVFAVLRDPGKDGAPDGMKVDIKGNVYSTGPGGVWVFSAQGRLLGKITPPEVPANIGWGDKDFRTLYMTARTGLYRVRLKIPGLRTPVRK